MRLSLNERFTLRLKVLAILAVGVWAGPSLLSGQTRTYEIRPSEDSRFALEVDKTRLMSGRTHLFLAESYRGQLEYNPENPAQSKVGLVLVIESASLVCQDTWVKPKERKKIQAYALEKMLAADQYPEIRFSSRSIQPLGDDRFQVSGDLTIREISKPVLVDVKLSGDRKQSLRFEGDAIVKMKDYGLKPPSAALGLVGTKNEMTVSFTLRATRKD